MATRETVRTMTAGQMKEVASALLEAIPTDLPFDQIQRRIGNKRELGKSLRVWLIGDQQDAKLLVEQSGVGEIYEEEVDYDAFRGKPIDRSQYVFVGDVTEKDYPETETGKKLVRFRGVWFDHDPTDDEILAKGKSIGGRQTSRAESETVIRTKYSSEELGRNPRIGLIGPAVQRSGYLSRACVHGYGRGVRLFWSWTGGRWSRNCRFVFVCE